MCVCVCVCEPRARCIVAASSKCNRTLNLAAQAQPERELPKEYYAMGFAKLQRCVTVVPLPTCQVGCDPGYGIANGTVPAFGNSPFIATCAANHTWTPSVTALGCAACANSSYTGSYYYCFCDPDDRRPGNVCEPCPTHTVPSPNNTQLCTCAPGFTTATRAGAGRVPGQGTGDAPTCVPCAANTYKAEPGVDACTPCPHGAYCTNGGRFVPRPGAGCIFSGGVFRWLGPSWSP